MTSTRTIHSESCNLNGKGISRPDVLLYKGGNYLNVAGALHEFVSRLRKVCMEAVACFAQARKRSQVLAFVASCMSYWEALSRRKHQTCVSANVCVATCQNCSLDIEMLQHAPEPGICAL